MTGIVAAVVEDHGDLRKSLGMILGGTPGFTCSGTYESAEDFLTDLESSPPQVVVMDIGLPGMSGIECVRRLRASHPEIHVLMLTISEEDDKVFQAICAGAGGYLLKRATPAEILGAINETAHGGVPMTPAIAQKVLRMFRDFAPPASDTGSTLTAREKEILKSLTDGMDYRQIAARHFISLDTVRNHIRHIYEKLQVHSKSEAVAKALRHRLV